MTGASAAYTVAHGAVLAVDSSCQTSSTVTGSTDHCSAVSDEVYTANTWRDDDVSYRILHRWGFGLGRELYSSS